MLIRNADMRSETRENMRGGGGKAELLHAVPKEALPAKSRLTATVTLNKGCGIGEHVHEGETEIIYVISGEGVLTDNGEERPFKKGDCNVCPGGESHAIRNESDEPLVLFAFIVLE